MSDPVETAELLAFIGTIEAKSLSRAAAQLGVPRATLGRRLARLEERLGTRLLRRTSRCVSLTDAGTTFYRQARLVLDAIAQAEASVRATHDDLRGVLRVSAPPMGMTPGAGDSFNAMVTSFAKQHHNVRLQVEFSSRIVDLLREGYDVALRATYEVQPNCIARTVSRNKVIAVASPAYLAQNGTPRSLKDLRSHRCLTCFARGEFVTYTWPSRAGVAHIESAFASNDLGLLRKAAVSGLGIALLPKLLLTDLMDHGQLVHVLPSVIEAEHHVAVVYPERQFVPAHVRAFVQSLVEWAPTLHRCSGGLQAPIEVQSA
jgi:DNA-binding transcriptional LysR family regulator